MGHKEFLQSSLSVLVHPYSSILANSLTPSIGFSANYALPDLSLYPHLDSLYIRGLFAGNDMDAVNDLERSTLRLLWKSLMDMLRKMPSSVRSLRFKFIPCGRLQALNGRTERLERVCNTFRYNFLHDGSPESVSRQVYDWSLLGQILSGREKLQRVTFEISRIRGGGRRDAWDVPQKEDLWRRYPDTVRIIKAALPKDVVYFRTISQPNYP